ncbi:MAG: helix-turn-helix domain-containing protein [Chitinophagaceae bacterium]
MAKPMPLAQRCFELSKDGFSYTAISRQLKVSKSAVYNHIRKYREHQPDTDSV